jgi:hypothetical protein
MVARESATYPQPWKPQLLTNLLRLVFRLSVLNEYEVLLGYSDFEGLVATAAGAAGFGSGWHYTLRSLRLSKWQPSTGGNPAKPRVTSSTILTPMLADDEARPLLADHLLGPKVFPSERLRDRLSNEGAGWSLGMGAVQHLRVLANLADQVSRSESPAARTELMQDKLSSARGLLDTVRRDGFAVAPTYEARIMVMQTALRDLIASESLP